MRRLVALFVVALVGAALYGLSGQSSGISVNHSTVSGDTLRSELAAISHNDSLQCFVTALSPTNYAPGAGGYSIKAAGAAAWANLRVEGLAINQYVTATYHYVPSADVLATAQTTLENEMTQQAKADSLDCPGTAADALAEMPSEMRTAEIESQATSQYLVEQGESGHSAHRERRCGSTTTLTSLTTTRCACRSRSSRPPKSLHSTKSQAAGISVAQLAKKYSQDASSSKGGAYGCYAPTNDRPTPACAQTSAPKGSTSFSTTPSVHRVQQRGVRALRCGHEAHADALREGRAQAVLSDLQSLNAEAASSEKNQLLEEAAVYVDPAFGHWGDFDDRAGSLRDRRRRPSGGVLGAVTARWRGDDVV